MKKKKKKKKNSNFANETRYMRKQNKEIEISEPRLVKSHDVKLDTEYAEWIAEVKHRYRSAQVKAAVKVNGEKLLFNWQMGRDLVQKKAEERWGGWCCGAGKLGFEARIS